MSIESVGVVVSEEIVESLGSVEGTVEVEAGGQFAPVQSSGLTGTSVVVSSSSGILGELLSESMVVCALSISGVVVNSASSGSFVELLTESATSVVLSISKEVVVFCDVSESIGSVVVSNFDTSV